MKKRFAKSMSLLVTGAILMTSVTVSASAESGIDVSLQGLNVTAKGTNTGEGAASLQEDYVLELDVKDGYEITDTSVIAYFEDATQTDLNYTYDETAETITVSWSENSDVFETATEISIKAKAAKEIDEASDITTLTELPFTEEFSFTEDMIMKLDEGYDFGVFASKLYSFDLSEGDTLYVKCVGADDLFADTKIVFGKSGENGEYIDRNLTGYGELLMYEIESDGKYVIACMCDDEYIGTPVSVEILTRSEGDALDFTAENTPEPDNDDLWSWDADTKTLTLYDGFEIVSDSAAIILPDDSTLIVKGNISIDAMLEGIRSSGSLDILLDQGAKVDIVSKYDAISAYQSSVVYKTETSDGDNVTIKGTVGENGELPEIAIDSVYGFAAISRNLSIENCKLDISAVLDAIYAYNSAVDIKNSDISTVSGYGISVFNGELNIENSKVTMVCDEECIYSDGYVGDGADASSVNTDFTVKNSTLDLTAGQEAIQVYYGDVIIENSKLLLWSDEEEGIYVGDGGSIIITGGSIDIKADENALETTTDGKIILEDVNFSLATLSDYDVISAENLSGDYSYFKLPGKFIMVDKVNDAIYEGEWNSEFIKDGFVQFENENGLVCYPSYIISSFDGDKADNRVEGVKNEYEQGEKITFTAVGGGEDELYPIWGFTRWNALNWEIVGTGLQGRFDNDNSGEIDTSSLEAGTYTLIVNFQQQSYSYKSWGYYTNPTDKHKDYVEIEFTVVADEEIAPDDNGEEIAPDDKGDEEIAPDDKGDEEVTPDNKGDEAVPDEDGEDVATDDKGDDEVTPDDGDENPNTSADSKALTAVAVTLAVLLALAGNTKRKHTLNK